LTVRLDEDKIESIISEKKPNRIAFNTPDGLLRVTRDFAKKLEERHSNLHCIVIGDPTYGSCDTVDIDAQRLGADVAFHIGHNVMVQKFGKITYSIDAFDDASFSSVVRKAAEMMKSRSFKTAGLATFAQHVMELPNVIAEFKNLGIDGVIGKGMGQLRDGQIFGCEFYPAYNIKDRVDVMLLLGQSMFHALGLCLSTGKPTFMLDPYSSEVIDVQRTADERLKRAILSIYKAKDADNFGIIIGLKEGQIMTDQSLKIKKKLESFGKSAQLIALREITSERIDAFTDLQAFVQTGCPRISIDGYTFSKPVLSVPQTDALINLLSGRKIESNILERKHWL
jgi:2-(3-amino-3-carboxypropyl)histidine synthase